MFLRIHSAYESVNENVPVSNSKLHYEGRKTILAGLGYQDGCEGVLSIICRVVFEMLF